MGYAPEAGKQNVGDQSFALLRTLPYTRDYGVYAGMVVEYEATFV